MKKLLSLLMVSVLGGVITLGAYKLFLEPEQKTIVQETQVQPKIVQTSHGDVQNLNALAEDISFVKAAEKTVHAVVHVKNVTVNRTPVTLQDLFFGGGEARPQVGTGSGVIISPDGYIVTNNHVIDGAQELSVTTNANKTFTAELVGSDPQTDIALLKIDADEDLPHITFADSDHARIGDWVLAVGNPFNLTSTVTAGIISAKSRDLSGQNEQSFIQTDAAVNPGNSGGALVDIKGDLIGINTAITSQTGSYIGYSFAVPSNIAKKVVYDILEYGSVQTGILGVIGGSLNSMSAKELGVDQTQGFYISDVSVGTGAEKAGLKPGDIIKKMDQVYIRKFTDLSGFLKSKRPNDVVNVTILRDGRELTLPVALSKKPLDQTTLWGMELRNLTPNAMKKLNLDGGVYIYKNTNYKLYKKLGLKDGYIITEINDEPIKSVDDIERMKKENGNDFERHIKRLVVVNEYGQKERYIFNND